MNVLQAASQTLDHMETVRVTGRTAALRGLTILADGLPLPVGSLVSFGCERGHATRSLGEIVGFSKDQAIIMALASSAGVRAGDPVVGLQVAQTVGVSDGMCGRVINGLGEPIDGKGLIHGRVPRLLDPPPIGAMERRRITRQLLTGVRAIDLMTPLGRGQRLGLFAGPGVGKSTLLGQIAKGTEAAVNVIALIGERGREVRDFIEHTLGEEGLKRSVVVVATGDESPLMRLRAARVAAVVAEWFRDQGRDVLLMMDSVTRFAHAQRQVGLSIGEPPATKGYTPSVFAALPVLLERAGSVEANSVRKAGSITGLYTILVEGDDMTEPVADAARGILDGHVILSRKLAHKGHFPAIDVLDSVSRVATDITSREQQQVRQAAVRLLASYREVEELVQIGAYARGSNAEADAAIELQPAINSILRQEQTEHEPIEQSRSRLELIARQAAELTSGRGKKKVG